MNWVTPIRSRHITQFYWGVGIALFLFALLAFGVNIKFIAIYFVFDGLLVFTSALTTSYTLALDEKSITMKQFWRKKTLAWDDVVSVTYERFGPVADSRAFRPARIFVNTEAGEGHEIEFRGWTNRKKLFKAIDDQISAHKIYANKLTLKRIKHARGR